VPKGEEIASLSYNYVLRVTTPTGAFQLGSLSSKIKQVYLVKPVSLTKHKPSKHWRVKHYLSTQRGINPQKRPIEAGLHRTRSIASVLLALAGMPKRMTSFETPRFSFVC
jgi:hypothetical protein